jgi:hypothetical protein
VGTSRVSLRTWPRSSPAEPSRARERADSWGAQAIIDDVVSPRERGRYTGYFGAVFGVQDVGLAEIREELAMRR